MKINRLETHDRLEHLKKDQSENIFKGAEECLKENPLSLAIQEKSPYVYIFAHPRTLGMDEKYDLLKSGRCTLDNIPEKVMMWQPRLSVPEAQENSYLFRAQSNSDVVEVCWLLPPKETWDQYKKGNVTESELVVWSINQFTKDKKALESPHPDDMPEERGRQILRQIIQDQIAKVSKEPKVKI